jgi:RNA polymerase sigma factor (sigma-70 family)
LNSHSITDNELMFKVKAGDLDKMGVLFERHHRALYGFFFYMTKKKDQSEDLVQTVFMRMLKSRDTFTGSGRFESWMYHIARNILKDQYRKEKRKNDFCDLSDIEDSMDKGALADLRLEKKEELKTLFTAMDKMSEEDKELLVLCRFQELKYSEIAKLLAISEGAVKVRVFRAMNELKRIFFDLHKETVTYDNV